MSQLNICQKKNGSFFTFFWPFGIFFNPPQHHRIIKVSGLILFSNLAGPWISCKIGLDAIYYISCNPIIVYAHRFMPILLPLKDSAPPPVFIGLRCTLENNSLILRSMESLYTGRPTSYRIVIGSKLRFSPLIGKFKYNV